MHSLAPKSLLFSLCAFLHEKHVAIRALLERELPRVVRSALLVAQRVKHFLVETSELLLGGEDFAFQAAALRNETLAVVLRITRKIGTLYVTVELLTHEYYAICYCAHPHLLNILVKVVDDVKLAFPAVLRGDFVLAASSYISD